MENSVVVQVIIYVGDQDGKSNAPPKLFDIGLDCGSMQAQSGVRWRATSAATSTSRSS